MRMVDQSTEQEFFGDLKLRTRQMSFKGNFYTKSLRAIAQIG